MTDDEPFLRTILAHPDDLTARLVYADWLDDRADPRAEYVRLGVLVTEVRDEANRFSIRDRMRELQLRLPSWWLAVVGYRVGAQLPRRARIDEVAQALNRLTSYINASGYRTSITTAATGMGGAIAYIDSRTRRDSDEHSDVLHLRAADGREASFAVYLPGLRFGSGAEFLEWYCDTVLMIYSGVHEDYACWFGFDRQPVSRVVQRGWIIDGRELFYGREHGETHFSRLSVPDLAELPPLSEADLRARELWSE